MPDRETPTEYPRVVEDPIAVQTASPTRTPAPVEQDRGPIATPPAAIEYVDTPVATQVSATAMPTVMPMPVASGGAPADPLTFSDVGAIPTRDLYDLARRFGRIDADVVYVPKARQAVGDTTVLWALDLRREAPFAVDAVLRHATEHADIYAEVGAGFSDDVMEQAATIFEEQVYPRVISAFSPPAASLESGSVALLHLGLPAADGYFDSSQEYPPAIYPFSNERRLIYLNTRNVFPASPGYTGLLAHEYQHALHWTIDDDEEGWVDEGLSVLANLLFADGEGFIYAYTTDHSDQLNAWTAGTGTAADYGSAGLLMLYLMLHYPDSAGGLGSLVARPEDGFRGIGAYLDEQGYEQSWRGLLAEWSAANYLDGRTSWDPYPDREIALGESRILRLGRTIETRQAVQFSPYYVGIDRGDDESYRIRFDGESTARLIPEIDHGPVGAWWSGGEDGADATLTRAFDLREAEGSALTLRFWHEIEDSWDFAYVVVSADGGESWRPVFGPSMRLESESSLGQALGPGYTGVSGDGVKAAWTDETIDLSAFDGKEILVRIEYVTDGSVNLTGYALGGAFLPAVGYSWDPAMGPGDWLAEGFFFGDGTVRQEFEVRLLIVRNDGTHEIVPMELNDHQVGTLDLLGVAVDRAALMIMPMAPVTRQSAAFAVSLESLANHATE